MTSFTLKNIPEPVYSALKQSATRNRRSINSEILTCLEQTYQSVQISPETFLLQARGVRATVGGAPFTAEEMQAAIESGRR